MNSTRSICVAALVIAIAACSSPTEARRPVQEAPKANAYAVAAAKRTAEDPKLVWTPAAVALKSTELATGVFAVYPDDAETKNASGVPVATSGGFIVGTSGVLLIDTMINRNLAGQLLALVAERTSAPVLYAVNTSYHGDHSYGNQFLPPSTKIVQHSKAQRYIQDKFVDDVAFMTQYFGTDSGLDELKPQKAHVLLEDGVDRVLDLGGIKVHVRHLGFAQSEGDLFVWLPAQKVLFTGNPILSGGPSFSWLLDGHAADATATLKRIRAEYPSDTIVIPGHGMPTDMGAIDRHIAYLEELQSEVAAARSKGLDAKEAAASITVSMKERWGGYALYPFIHGELNIAKAYAEAGATK